MELNDVRVLSACRGARTPCLFQEEGRGVVFTCLSEMLALIGVCCGKSAIPGHDVAKVGGRRPRMPPQPCCHVVVARPLWCREGFRDIIIVSNLLCKWIEEKLSQESSSALEDKHRYRPALARLA